MSEPAPFVPAKVAGPPLRRRHRLTRALRHRNFRLFFGGDQRRRQPFMREMVDDRADLPNAIALNSSLVNGARMLGPVIAAALVGLVGLRAASRARYVELGLVDPWGARSTDDGTGHTVPCMDESWPDLASPGGIDTAGTLRLWSQIIGKTRMAFEPMCNHWWQVTLFVTPRGLATPVLHDGDRAFDVELDLHEHALRIRDAAGPTRSFELAPMTLAEFYDRYRAALGAIGVELRIWPHAVEMPESIWLDRDQTVRKYDPAWARALATALLRTDTVFKEFRGRFLGKVSPVHFFWGAFDLAVTRFSGRPAPPHPGGIPNCGDWVMREAYSHEVSSAGFWPGDANFPEAVFYSYAYPQPGGFADATVLPDAARWDASLGEFVLPYEAVRRSPDPARDVLAFLQSTYDAAADLGGWDRRALER